jgi:hypothetical protein
MAHIDGQTKWNVKDTRTDEEKEVDRQTLDFINDNLDIFLPILERLDQFKSNADGDRLLLLSASLGIVSNEIFDFLKACALVSNDKGTMN